MTSKKQENKIDDWRDNMAHFPGLKNEFCDTEQYIVYYTNVRKFWLGRERARPGALTAMFVFSLSSAEFCFPAPSLVFLGN